MRSTRVEVLQRILAPAVVALLVFSSCAKRNAGPAPAPPPPAPGEKRSVIGRIFSSGEAAPGYRWDGQVSSTSVAAPLNVAFARSVEVLRAMGFVLKTEETRREGANARITAAKPDKTLATLVLMERGPANTEVKAKVGAVGDRTGSERLLDEIQKALQKQPTLQQP